MSSLYLNTLNCIISQEQLEYLLKEKLSKGKNIEDIVYILANAFFEKSRLNIDGHTSILLYYLFTEDPMPIKEVLELYSEGSSVLIPLSKINPHMEITTIKRESIIQGDYVLGKITSLPFRENIRIDYTLLFENGQEEAKFTFVNFLELVSFIIPYENDLID